MSPNDNEFRLTLDRIQIVISPESSQPFPVDAIVIEQDTYLVLTPLSSKVRIPKDSLKDLVDRATNVEPKTPGEIVINPTVPLQMYAIIHDLNRDPSWCEEWICCAIDSIVKNIEHHSIEAIAIPFLGTVHGTFDSQRFLKLFREALLNTAPPCLKRIWLYTPEKIDDFSFEFID